MRWSIAPTDEFMEFLGVWIPGRLDSLGVWIPWSIAPTDEFMEFLGVWIPGRLDSPHFFLLKASTSASIRSSSGRGSSRPLATTAAIFVVLWMSASGSASSRTRSASLPGSTVPRSFSRPKNRAGSRVAAWSASRGVKPHSATSRASSSCRLKPGKTYGTPGVSVPARNGTPAWCIARTRPVARLYARFSQAAVSGDSFISDQYEWIKSGGMYLTRESAVNFGSSRLTRDRRTVRVGTCQVPLRTKRA